MNLKKVITIKKKGENITSKNKKNESVNNKNLKAIKYHKIEEIDN